MFMAWVEAFAGRLESRFSISPALAYLPVPWSDLSEGQRAELSSAFEQVEAVRARYPTASLSALYGPTSMPPELLDAHRNLDRRVDRTYSSRRTCGDNAARLGHLMASYTDRESTSQLRVGTGRKR